MVTILAGLVKVRRIDDWVMLLARNIMGCGSATAYTQHVGEQLISLCVFLLLAFMKFQSKLHKSMQQILRLLQLNIFEKRDLMALLPGDLVCNNQSDINQMALL